MLDDSSNPLSCSVKPADARVSVKSDQSRAACSFVSDAAPVAGDPVLREGPAASRQLLAHGVCHGDVKGQGWRQWRLALVDLLFFLQGIPLVLLYPKCLSRKNEESDVAV